MTALECLKSLKSYIESKVCKNLKLQSENSQEYVNPNAYIMHLPRENFNTKDFTVPFLAVELDSATDDVEGCELDIRITVATYGGGYYFDKDENRTDVPDDNGYEDLINAIELTKQALLENSVLDGKGAIRKPINFGTYDVDAPYPYWYGFLKFKVDIPNNDYVFNSDLDF